MKKLICLLVLLVASCGLYAQVEFEYLKNNGRLVEKKEDADYIRTVYLKDSAALLYNVVEYYPSGGKKFEGVSTKKEYNHLIDQSISYFPNGKKSAIKTYVNGNMVGKQFFYYPNGNLYITANYISVNNPAGSNTVGFRSDEKIIDVYDSTGVIKVTNGTGYFERFTNDFKKIKEKGNLVNSLREGKWLGEDEKAEVTFVEDYKNDSLLTGTATGFDGKVYQYTIREILPQYKGGVHALTMFIAKNIIYPKFARENGIQGMVIVGLVITGEGNVANIDLIKSASPDLNEEALRVVGKMNEWEPAIFFGKKVAMEFQVPIKFSLN